jgi:DUF1680 family protein
VAHARATGKRALLAVAVLAWPTTSRGTSGPPRGDGWTTTPAWNWRWGTLSGHGELYRATGNGTYLRLARFLLDERGQRPSRVTPDGRRRLPDDVVAHELRSDIMANAPRVQDHVPVRQWREMVGHGVRATYLTSGMADVALETGDPDLADALEHLWRSAFTRKAYVTGGLGAHWPPLQHVPGRPVDAPVRGR